MSICTKVLAFSYYIRTILPIIPFIPLCKLAQPLAEGDLWGEPKGTLQGGSVRIGGGDVAGLHGDELLVGFEVVVLREDAGTHQFLLKDVDEVEQVLRLAAADVIHGIGRDGQAVFPLLASGGTRHHAHDALYNVVHVSEVPAAITVVVDLDGLASEQLVGEPEVGHVGASGRAVDRKEAQTRGRNII